MLIPHFVLFGSMFLTSCYGDEKMHEHNHDHGEGAHDHTQNDGLKHSADKYAGVVYACPMHPEITGEKGENVLNAECLWRFTNRYSFCGENKLRIKLN